MAFINRKRGMSIIEMAVILAIASILIAIGGLNYFKFVRQAKSKEAKHSLSHLYLQEKTFFNHWDTYHENLFALGAMPNGELVYDVGFKVAASDISVTDGLLKNYPTQHDAKKRLKVEKCTTYKHACESTGCLKEIKTLASASTLTNQQLKDFFGDPDNTGCSVKGDYVSNDISYTSVSDPDFDKDKLKADADGFIAVAIGQITPGNKDIWSIDQDKTVKHVQSGL